MGTPHDSMEEGNVMSRRRIAVPALFGFILLLAGCSSQSPEGEPPVSSTTVPAVEIDYASLKIVPPPDGGIYLGQHGWNPRDITTFEAAIGREAALFSSEYPMAVDDDFDPVFRLDVARETWEEGRVVVAHAYGASPMPNPIRKPGFTVDKLLQGEYDEGLRRLADQFREFGKPMFFFSTREPNGIGEEWLGGFGPAGDQDIWWALDNEKGIAEFGPSGFPNASLYTDLGDPNVSDGVERLVAAQRYYHDFFVRQEGLTFLTFDSMGWAAVPWQDFVEEFEVLPGEPNYELIRTSYGFDYVYPGDEYVDWVSITWYMMDWGVVNTPIVDQLGMFALVMEDIRATAPDKPVLIIEMGFPDGEDPDSEWAAEKVTAGLNELVSKYPEVGGFAMWSQIEGLDPMDALVRPGTAQGDAFRGIVEANPARFRSCVYFSDGTRMPACEEE